MHINILPAYTRIVDNIWNRLLQVYMKKIPTKESAKRESFLSKIILLAYFIRVIRSPYVLYFAIFHKSVKDRCYR